MSQRSEEGSPGEGILMSLKLENDRYRISIGMRGPCKFWGEGD